jgi:hypothetical protein
MTSKSRRTGERSLRRRVAIRNPRRTFVIFCEGERTEPEYLNALKLLPPIRDVAAVDLRVQTGNGGSVPRTLVSMAASARRRAMDEEAEVDEVWCVFDVEWPRNHPGLREAIQEAERNDVRVAISNPCFELWLILHFRAAGSWLDTQGAVRLRHELDGSTDKSLEADLYMPNVPEAARRATLLDKRHRLDGTRFPHDNPSSGMHRLIQAIQVPTS